MVALMYHHYFYGDNDNDDDGGGDKNDNMIIMTITICRIRRASQLDPGRRQVLRV